MVLPQTDEIQGLKVLLVESDKEFRELIVHLIKASVDPHAQIHCLSIADDAYFQLHREEYDLLLTSYDLLGEHDGLWLWDMCCNTFPNLPAVLLSGRNLENLIASIGKRSRYPTILPRPFRLSELHEIVTSLTYKIRFGV